jgi:cytochrome c oxidase subunit 2
LLFVVAPFVGWWLPEGVSTHSPHVDFLYYVILAITGFFYVLTEAILVYFIIRFAAPETGREPMARPKLEEHTVALVKKVIPNEHRLELAWTIVPAAILLYIAFAQVSTWAEMKFISRMPSPEQRQIAVSARQFEWRMRYPSPSTFDEMKTDKKIAANWFNRPQIDDVHVVNELHVWTNEKGQKNDDFPAFVCWLSTLDVQHNLNLPHFRVKQDALPGKIIPVWFRPTKANGEWKNGKWVYRKDANDKNINWEIACAELCGRWHYHMIGRVYVHPSEENYREWLVHAAAIQNATQRAEAKVGR